MSSSSSSATARSRSPSPATPEASDSPEPVVVSGDTDFSWLNADKVALPHGHAWDSTDATLSFLSAAAVSAPPNNATLKAEHSMNFNDLIQEDIFDEPLMAGFAATCHSSPSFSDGMGTNSVPPSLGPAFSIPDFLASPQFSLPPPQPQTAVASPQPSEEGSSSTFIPPNVVYPAREACYNLPIIVPNIPEQGTKSRVETQIRVTVDLAFATTSSGGYDRVGSWKWLRLPKGTSTKKRTRKEGKIAPASEDTLQLGVEVICASPPHTRVLSCQSCQNREAKRVARKIAARVRPPRSDSESLEDGAAATPSLKAPHTEDTTSIVQFNCPETIDFVTGSAVLPLRITCYCRHHREKVGFRVQFTMLDSTGRIVGQGTSAPIMITDDHKSSGTAAAKKGTAVAAAVAGADAVGRKDSVSTTAPRKRAKPYDGRPGRKATGTLASPSSGMPSLPVTRSVSPSGAPTPMWLSDMGPIVASENSWDPATSLPSPSSSIHNDGLVDMMESLAALVPKPDPAPTTFVLPTAPPSPELQNMPTTVQQVPPRPFMFFSPNGTVSMSSLPAPVIHRLVPAKGPTAGGTEVTVLGMNFPAGVDIKCVFGDTAATSTQRWSENTLVCIVPPRLTPGVVPVWLEGVEKPHDGASAPMFTYEDESDRALMELALQVLGLKLTGKVEDPKNVALRIVGNTGTGAGDAGSVDAGGVGMMQVMSAAASGASLEVGRLLGSQRHGEFEHSILRLLSLLDVKLDGAMPGKDIEDVISHRNESGQTLLHLAVLLDLHAVVDFLLAHVIDVDARDRNGYTALHFAASTRSEVCARVLVTAGADLSVVNARGQTPRELAPRRFFDTISVGVGRDTRDWEDEEAAWGDGEDEAEAETARPRRRTHRRRGTTQSSTATPTITSTAVQEKGNGAEAVPPYELPAENEKNGLGATVVDEKQVASYADAIQRAFAQQLQRSRGILPGMLQLPGMPHLPPLNLPGMPTVPWGAFPQIPMVFPVMVPGAGAWPAFLDTKRSGEGEGERGAMAATAVKAAQEWRTFWEKWMTQGVNAATLGIASTQEAGLDDAPPVYTPPMDPLPEQLAPKEKTKTPVVSVQPESSRAAGARRKVHHESHTEEIQEGCEYEYRPVRKPATLMRNNEDRMLKWFWIPTLFIGFFWALCTVLGMVVHGMRTMVALRTGIQI